MNKKYSKFLTAFALLMIVSALCSAFAFAETVTLNPDDPTGLQEVVKSGSNKAATTIRAVSGTIAAVLIMWGAILFMTANGDSQKIAAAKDRFKYSLVGVVVCILADKIVGMVKGWVV